LTSKFSYAAAVFFVAGMVLAITQTPPPTFSGPPPTVVVAVTMAFVLFHLSLLPVVAALDAPAWAKASGYVWIAVDNVINFLSYFGVGADLVIPMRWGIHLACATWIVGASGSAAGAMRWVGFLEAVALAGASFIGPFVGQAMAGQTLGPAGLLLVIWLVLVGGKLSRA
jgi:hypothetical protein